MSWLKENRPQLVRAQGAKRVSHGEGLFYLNRDHDRPQRPDSTPKKGKAASGSAMRRAEGEREGEEIPLAG